MSKGGRRKLKSGALARRLSSTLPCLAQPGQAPPGRAQPRHSAPWATEIIIR